MSALNNWFRGIDLDSILEWLMFAAAALIAISVHESAHALSAHWLGDDTAKRMGRISLNPLRHLDVAGFLMMVVAHFGWARPVPVDPRRMTKIRSPKAGMAITAAAGPVSNVLLALLFGIAFEIVHCLFVKGLLSGTASSESALSYLRSFLYVCFALNAGLAVFNLIPISPLDGSKVLAILLPERIWVQLMRYERYGMLVLIALLFLGVLDGPLTTLRGGLMDAIDAVALPLARAVTGL